MTARGSLLALLAVGGLAAFACVGQREPRTAEDFTPVEVYQPLMPAVVEPPLPSPPLAEVTLPRPARSTPPAPPSAPVLVRIGLASDLPSLRLPCCQSGLVAKLPGEDLALASELTVVPAEVPAASATFRLQAAALRDEAAANELATRLGTAARQPAVAHYDAAVDLYRVRVGQFATRAEAEAARRASRVPEIAQAWIIEEPLVGGSGAVGALAVSAGERSWRVIGRWLALEPPAGVPFAFQGRRYRGRLAVFLNDRGTLNVVNELPLEDYLRGVVPAEMGPEVYPRLESLKAQAVAARTYTLRNLGGFAAEGYDLCATPRCQVYGGFAAEHPFSDRAVAETADQVLLFEGKPIDALYTATCGGHTEDAHVIFPERQVGYLKGVPCPEQGEVRIASSLAAGTRLPEELAAAEEAGRVRRIEARYEERQGNRLHFAAAGTELRLTAGAKQPAYRLEEGVYRAGELRLAAGDRVRFFFEGETLVAMAQEADPRTLPRDPPAALARWTRFKSDGELARRVGDRYPGLGFASFEVLERGVSGRVGRLRLLGRGGRSAELAGLDVRFLLDLPETQFTASRSKTRKGGRGWTFTGRGWGHGVGLCQVGSFNLAGRGQTYREILTHFYRGAQLARVKRG
jgi:SpoIID/LytB domain protein